MQVNLMNSKNFSINSEYKNVSSVCFIVKTFCEDNNVSEAYIREIELSLAEALNNIIKHAYKGDESKVIEVNVEIDENKVEITLTDFGGPRENLDKPKLEFDPNDIDSLPEGGMGLFIIEQLMDKNIYSTDEKQNTFKLIKNIT